MSTKFLDDSGLAYFWSKLKTYLSGLDYFPLKGVYVSSGTHDLNDYVDSGFWVFDSAVAPENRPIGTNGMLIVFRVRSDRIRQFWLRVGTLDVNDHQFYFREKLHAWSTWKKIYTSADVIPVANGGTGSDTQNFVDLTTAQAIGGTKNFTSEPQWNGLDISGKSSNYCSDCNTALVPGRYYIDENTLNVPDSYAGKSGILTVEGMGGGNGIVFQFCLALDYDNDATALAYARCIRVSNGVLDSAWEWAGFGVIGNWLRTKVFRPSGSAGLSVLCPPAGQQVPSQTASVYEFLRFYHVRDTQRDGTLNSYGNITRYTASTDPTSGNFNNNSLTIGSVEGGVYSANFVFRIYARCASVVTYTDNTTETVYGKYLKVGDTYNNKVVSAVTYTREAGSGSRFEVGYDNIIAIGDSSNRFSVVYAGTGSIDTSDERLKDSVSLIPEDVLDAWGGVVWLQYRFKDAVGRKGDGARLHTGAVAQRIDSVFRERGLDASRYGLFCHDVWEDEYDEDEEGVRHRTKEAGDRYSLRYEEALAMEAAYMRRENARLKERVSDLEDRLAALELRLGSA